MADEQQTEERQETQGQEGASSAADRAKDKAEAWDQAHEKMREMEEMDDPPSDLKEWPDDEAKYVTYGGGEGDHGYDEGPEAKLGPSSLERHEDGSVTIEGEEVDNPEEYRSDDPIEGASQVAGGDESEESEESEESDESEESADSGEDDEDR